MPYYGEEGIDRLVRQAFFPDMSFRGVMVEVGAAGPSFLSISKHYRDSGWRVVSVEPNPQFASRHRELGHEILEYACGERDEDGIAFQVAHPKVQATHGAVTFESFSAIAVKEEYRNHKPEAFADMDVETIHVNMRRLDTLLDYAKVDRLDVLTVDVEGWELEVLTSLDFAQHSPRVIVIENWLRDPKYVEVVVSYGYTFVCRLYPNDVFVKAGEFSAMSLLRAKAFAAGVRIRKTLFR
jgi:FkbM family methyltransferase